MNKLRKSLAVLCVPLVFLVVSLVVIKDYGISWDEPIHFIRGHAYLHYFITGDRHYSDKKTSYYQTDVHDGEYFFENDSGHPPLNDILAALSNYVFFQKLGIAEDVISHHIFNIFSGFLLLVVVSLWAYRAYGVQASVFASLSVATYPLFFSETQFNIKDIPQAAFFAICLYSLWESLRSGQWRWLVVSAVAFGFSFGMKFNILFLPFIVGPYLAIRYSKQIIKYYKHPRSLFGKVPRKFIFAIAIYPAIVVAIFWGTWPYLWSHPINNFQSIFGYYKQIGTGTNYQTAYLLPGNINAYAPLWILITTPPVVLILSAIGIVSTLIRSREAEKTSLLWLLWFIVPIARVSVPGASIYGGVRQIFEYVPAIGLLAGLGAVALYNAFMRMGVRRVLAATLLILLFIPHLFVLKKIHPNQNVYFNSLIGGLPGAMAKGIPYWGNSFGNAYKQAIDWLNVNAEEGARLALVQGTSLNIPTPMLREDIDFSNNHWSGINRKGEYLLELTHHDTVRAYPYAWDYVETFLEPVFEVDIDGVAIAKLWKNSFEHTRSEFRNPEFSVQINSMNLADGQLIITLSKTVELTRLYIYSSECRMGSVYSAEENFDWIKEKEDLGTQQLSEAGANYETGFFFPARRAQFIKIITEPADGCKLVKEDIKVFALAR